MLPLAPLIAAIRSSQTPVGWLEIRLPPVSAAAFADHSGFTYTLAPAYGLSTLPEGSLPPPPPPPPLPSSTLQVTHQDWQDGAARWCRCRRRSKPKLTEPPVASVPL